MLGTCIILLWINDFGIYMYMGIPRQKLRKQDWDDVPCYRVCILGKWAQKCEVHVHVYAGKQNVKSYE